MYCLNFSNFILHNFPFPLSCSNANGIASSGSPTGARSIRMGATPTFSMYEFSSIFTIRPKFHEISTFIGQNLVIFCPKFHVFNLRTQISRNFRRFQQKYSRLNSLQLAHADHMERIRRLEEGEDWRLNSEMLPAVHKLASRIQEFDTVVLNALTKRDPNTVAIYLVGDQYVVLILRSPQ